MIARFLIGAMCLANVACSSRPQDTLIFEAQTETFRLELYSSDRIVVRLGDEVRVFAIPIIRYPRWNGVQYEAVAEDARLRLEVRDDRPCADAPRTARVQLTIDDLDFTGCGRRLDGR
jgi:hypothetical protein